MLLQASREIIRFAGVDPLAAPEDLVKPAAAEQLRRSPQPCLFQDRFVGLGFCFEEAAARDLEGPIAVGPLGTEFRQRHCIELGFEAERIGIEVRRGWHGLFPRRWPQHHR